MERSPSKRSGRTTLAAVLLALVLGVVAPWVVPSTALADEGDAIVLIHSNDVHCAGLATSASAIGYAGIAQAANDARATYGTGNVTLIDAGDAIQGQPIGLLSQGLDLVDLMNDAGYDIAVPGNHEFDYGIERLQTLSSDYAEYPYVSCNVLNTETNQPLFPSFEIFDYNVGGQTVKVAYVGITTPTTLTSESPSIFQNAAGDIVWSFYGGNDGQDLYDQVQSAVDDAHAAGADYVIAVAHLGKDAGSSVPAAYTSTAVAAHTTGIDAIIDGHTHEIYNTTVPNEDGEAIPIAQCGTQFQAYGTMTITPDGDPGPDDITSAVTVAADQAEPVSQDATVAEAVQAKQDALAGQLDQVVGTSKVGLSVYGPDSEGNPYWWVARMRETNLGDFVTDAYRAYLDADVAFVNGGGLRAPTTAIAPMSNGTFGFAAGPLTYNTLMSINSFGNPVSLVKVSGQDLLDALEYSVRAVTPAMDDATEAQGSFLQVSGIEFTANIDIPSPVVLNESGGFGSIPEGATRRVSDVTVDGKPIDPQGTYTLSTISYVLQPGGNYTMFADCEYVIRDAGMDYQILADYLQKDLGGTIGYVYGNPAGSGRINYAGEGVEPGTVAVYRLYNPWLNGAHLYTSDLGEVQTLTGLGWRDEGARYTEYAMDYAPEGSEGYEPVYRLYNRANGDHFYTTSLDECRSLMEIDLQNGWVSDGVAWYAPQTSELPVYRLYNPWQRADGGLGNHLWTIEKSEVDTLVPLGWLEEGTGWYAVAK